MSNVPTPCDCLFAGEVTGDPQALIAAFFLVYSFDEFLPLPVLADLDLRLTALAEKTELATHIELLRVQHQLVRPLVGLARPERLQRIIDELTRRVNRTLIRPLADDGTRSSDADLLNRLQFEETIAAVSGEKGSPDTDWGRFDWKVIWTAARKGALRYRPARVAGIVEDAATEACLKLSRCYRQGPEDLVRRAAPVAGYNCAIDACRRMGAASADSLDAGPEGSGHHEAPPASWSEGMAFYQNALRCIATIARCNKAYRDVLFAELVDVPNTVLSHWLKRTTANLNADRHRGRAQMRRHLESAPEQTEERMDHRSVMRLLEPTALLLAGSALDSSGYSGAVCTEDAGNRHDDDDDDEDDDDSLVDVTPSARRNEAALMSLRAEVLARAARRDGAPDELFESACAGILYPDVIHALAEIDHLRLDSIGEETALLVDEYAGSFEAILRWKRVDRGSDLRGGVLRFTHERGASVPGPILAVAAAGALGREAALALREIDGERVREAERAQDRAFEAFLSRLARSAPSP